jgi:hypothetical protein
VCKWKDGNFLPQENHLLVMDDKLKLQPKMPWEIDFPGKSLDS